MPDSGCESSRSFSSASGTSLSRVTRTSTLLPWIARPVKQNPRLTQNAQHVVVEAQPAGPAHRIGVDLEEEARSALQVETEHDVALRPGRPLADHVFGKEVRYCEQAHDERREQDTPPPSTA